MISRRTMFALSALSVAALCLPEFTPALVLINLTSSVPVGLYLALPGRPAAGDYVRVATSDQTHALAVSRGYIVPGLPLLKRAAAIAGSRVCRSGSGVWIDGHIQVWVRRIDRAGRALPVWSECRVLKAGEIFVLGSHRDSYDGRYFGPIPLSQGITRVVPIWLF